MTDRDPTTHLLSRRAALRLGLAGGVASLSLPHLLGKPALDTPDRAALTDNPLAIPGG